ncbi:hypothetical protein CVT26_007440 [Gymnopilus dilepis]|uniref:Alpha/beta hydrolase fold-3 domain-containing protein n=1 Tax=Gymnopilus dilepis TaxID=231916 RepID=A0A409W7W6_9AGAR|nr:hypothetical protein CVT26_007440 [Gymnopilus dilepis]
MPSVKKPKYGDVSYWDLLHIATIWARLPFALVWTYARNLLFNRGNLVRANGRHLVRWANERYTVPELQYLLPTSVEAYKRWAQTNNLPIILEELVDDTVIMWIGPKRTDKVVLYIPGGAFWAPLLDYSLSFWQYVQKELHKKDCDVGFAILAYSLVPEATFPTQLRQAMLGVEHLLATGLHPSNLHLVSDSAGGNVLLSLFSHILHPLDGLRSMMPLSAPIRSAYLMSPWVRLRSESPSFKADPPDDLLSAANEVDYSSKYLAGVMDNQQPYAEPDSAPESWFDGLDSVVERVLMTAGEKELFRDDIIHFSNRLCKTKSNFSFVIQEGGTHNDPMFDFFLQLPHDQLGSLTSQIVDWLAKGIRSTA